MFDDGHMWPVSVLLYLVATLVCTLIFFYPNQYFKGVQVPCVSTEIYHTVYKKDIYTNVKCINVLFITF